MARAPKAPEQISMPQSELSDKKRDEALDATLKQIDKNYGTGSIMRLADRPSMNLKGI